METAYPNKCLVCRENAVRSSLTVCAECRKKETGKLLKAQAFQDEHPGASRAEIAEGTDIPYKVINWYFINGELGENQQDYINNVIEKNSKGLTIGGALYGRCIWLEVSGELDAANAMYFQQYVDCLIADEWTNFIIDMGSVTFLCLAGIRVVMLAYKKLRELGGNIQIVNPSANVRNVLGIVELDALLL